MKWVRKTEWRRTKFKEVDEGECFFDAREEEPENLLMKIRAQFSVNTIVMDDGILVAYDEDDIVIPVDAEVVIE